MEDEIRKRFEENEKRIDALEAKLNGTELKSANAKVKVENKVWYKPNSTVGRLMGLFSEGFFDTSKTLTEVSTQFKARDYHYELSDLTLPVRQLVRHGLLRREKIDSKWAYVKI